MYRLLIVDDEEIITDSLYEVFSRLMSDQLDVCKAYSAAEALDWMSRTRIDVVLTDIRMPGKSGLELSEEIQAYWPRCRVIFLTGYSEFDYVYQAIQMSDARYVLKTEGYDKVIETVREALQDVNRNNRLSELAEQSREQKYALEWMAQGDYVRHLLQESQQLCRDRDALRDEFRELNIALDPFAPVALILSRYMFPEGITYSRRSELLNASRLIWRSYLSERTRYVGIVDKNGDWVWMLQPSEQADEAFPNHMIRYLEGTLELIQESCLESLGLAMSITVSGAFCGWETLTSQYERLRRLQQHRIGDGLSIVLTDCDECDIESRKTFETTEDSLIPNQAEIMAAHLEADRKEKFFACLEDLTSRMLHPDANVQRTVEAYYALALALFGYMNRWGLHGQIGEVGKLMRLDDHASMREGFQYLSRIADSIFSLKRLDEKERAASAIDRICRYVNEHLGEDLSLVRLAEINHFNPTYLSRFFKQERGINLSDYIDQCRIRKAMELLKDGEIKVREVSAAVGYEAAHSFTRFFKKATGMTPQEYRDSIPIG
ncbi:response regulator [Cohnella sp. REN36]|uniref:response regulator n=1 Tax=Cohnella sp. REN36 TaxID=2887347 RepID=UPI001D141488|nr:response regulator [Cohnella sp. REN36]MCC3372041.1 response regulator [Cohnella sp. REN36]